VFLCCKFSNTSFLDINLAVSSAEFKTSDVEMTVTNGLKNRILTSVDWIQNVEMTVTSVLKNGILTSVDWIQNVEMTVTSGLKNGILTSVDWIQNA
jgi:hypothetical protein